MKFKSCAVVMRIDPLIRAIFTKMATKYYKFREPSGYKIHILNFGILYMKLHVSTVFTYIGCWLTLNRFNLLWMPQEDPRQIRYDYRLILRM